MKKTHYKIFLCFLLACSMSPLFYTGVLACLCGSSKGTLEEQVAAALDYDILVFTGSVISITRIPPEEYTGIIKNLAKGFANEGEELSDMGLENVHILVQEIFKGPVTDTICIQSVLAYLCTFEFEQGKRYLVYMNAKRDDDFYTVGKCSRTQEIHSMDKEKKEIELLRNLREDE